MNLQLIRLTHCYDEETKPILVAIDLKHFDRTLYAVDFICLDIQWIASDFDEHRALTAVEVAKVLEYCYKSFVINDLSEIDNLNIDTDEIIDIELFTNWERSIYWGKNLSFEDKEQQIERFTSISSVGKEEKEKFIQSLLS